MTRIDQSGLKPQINADLFTLSSIKDLIVDSFWDTFSLVKEFMHQSAASQSSKKGKTIVLIEYPQVIKMYMRSQIEVEPSASLSATQDQIFKNFWDTFASMKISSIHVHGKREDVTLKDGEDVIDTDALFQERLKTKNSFQAVFIKH